MLRDCDVSFIRRTVDGDSGCLEAKLRMVYCAAFDCNTKSSKNIVTRGWPKFCTELSLFKKANFEPLSSRKHVSTAIRRMWQP